MIIRPFDTEYENLQNERSGLDLNSNEIVEHIDIIESHILVIRTFLDIGCRGNAPIVKYFHDRGVDSYGVDIGTIAESQWDKANLPFRNKLKRYDIHNGIPFKKKFDLISLSHVIEHLYNPMIVIRNVKEKLSDSGLIWSTVPLEQNNSHRPHYTIFSKHSEHIGIWEYNGFKVLWDDEGFNGQPCSYLIACK